MNWDIGLIKTNISRMTDVISMVLAVKKAIRFLSILNDPTIWKKYAEIIKINNRVEII